MSKTKRLSITIISSIAVGALAVAGCGGDDEGDEAAASAGDGGAVSVESIDGMDVLVDAEGRALYTADQEAGGQVLCIEGCTADWDPVMASGEAPEVSGVDQPLDVIERPDGGRQLTFDGKPLYRFTDEGPGEVTGDGFVDKFDGTRFEWHAALTGEGSDSTSPEQSSAPSGGSFSY
jgi:predicted lipoprotein with Yx(FWY)xxD motif